VWNSNTAQNPVQIEVLESVPRTRYAEAWTGSVVGAEKPSRVHGRLVERRRITIERTQ
jgi:hypothetical protein